MTPVTERKRDARQAIEDLELDKHLATAGAAAAKLAQEAVSLVGTYADDHREQAHGLLDRAESEADRVTGGRATDLLGKVRSGLAAGVDLVADQRPDPAAAASESTDAPGSGDADSGGAGSGDTDSDDPGQPPSAG
ncbi:hypothetical protein [Janibacter hoylei]|uniref:hypothetical protein n=1 Tax=Janibacter hoylei TaxID=364298 RepID=UPI0021A2B14F|nr:hypothetical protein [Janibacter hoylei]MCT1618965.1 hypothetical protein [Janibacter hoylei]MCT2292604.1 hypothetical protein [Janibacter hoylei]